jgi:hypothetical protein
MKIQFSIGQMVGYNEDMMGKYKRIADFAEYKSETDFGIP